MKAAATDAIEIDALTYGSVHSIDAARQRVADGALILHSNIRGLRYYQ